jgi:hypothetical protein
MLIARFDATTGRGNGKQASRGKQRMLGPLSFP